MGFFPYQQNMPLFWIKRASPVGAEVNLRNRGLSLMLIAMIVAPVMDAIAKYLSTDINGGQVVLVRFGMQAIVLLPVVWVLLGPKGLKPVRWKLAIMRGILAASAVASFFTALKWLPVADAMAIFFVEPLILTILSATFLGEKVGWRRMTAVAVGLVGALIIIRPSFEQFGAASLLPLLTAFLFAVYLALTSKLARDHHPLTLQFSAGLSAFVFMAVVLAIGTFSGFELLSYNAPNPVQWAFLGLVGVIGTATHLMIVFAFKWAPASLLAPFHYLEIVVAAILGYLIFDDFPDALTWLGIAIIIGSGLYVIWREGQAGED